MSLIIHTLIQQKACHTLFPVMNIADLITKIQHIFNVALLFAVFTFGLSTGVIVEFLNHDTLYAMLVWSAVGLVVNVLFISAQCILCCGSRRGYRSQVEDGRTERRKDDHADSESESYLKESSASNSNSTSGAKDEDDCKIDLLKKDLVENAEYGTFQGKIKAYNVEASID